MENIKVNYLMARDMEKEPFISSKEVYTKDHGSMIKCMDTVNFFILMEN